ncbi:efflux RND transporter permease subunit [Thioflexithrix psekupsensis]|uniref:efflux RND transporter permease subunit n=1 Tax=Thioflexithrix psekupsensis TaxID=1570016 RepID=UPI001C3E0ED5
MFFSIAIPISGLNGLFEPLRWPVQMSQMIWDEPIEHSWREKWLSQVDLWQEETTHFWRNQFADYPLLARFEQGLGSEFMPELFEGDLMYMPTTLPGIGIGKAQELLQQTNRLIASFPEVKSVFGKMGAADTATDPAPLNMVETVIQLHPPELWREGMTLARLIEEFDHVVNIPGVTNAWVMPIKTRIDMLATGIKTPLGVKISGADLDVIQKIGQELERILMALPGTRSAYSERVADGRYIEIIPDRVAAARFGLNINEINEMISIAVGGMTITQTVEGRERYPVSIRFPRELRDSFDGLARLPLILPNGMQVPLDQIAEIKITSGAPMLTSENARLNGWTFVDVSPEVDLGRYIEMAQQHVRESLSLPAGYSLVWSGQYEYMLRVKEWLKQVLPLTLMIIFILLYLTFNRIGEAILVMVTLPFALVGGFWLIYLLGFNWSVAVAVGFIALAGVAAEFGVIMLVYLDNALKQYQAENRLYTHAQLKAAIMEGAVLRVRPKAMTVLTLIVGLIPIFLTEGTGSEVMQRIAAPMIGGMVTAPLLSLFVMPALYLLWKQPVVKKNAAERWPEVVG